MKRFTSAIIILALSACTPVPMDDATTMEQSEGLSDIDVINELVENDDAGPSMVHTVLSEDTTYTVEITPTEGLGFRSTWTVESGDTLVERSAEFELLIDDEGGLSVEERDPDAARQAYAVIGELLAGTEIEVALASGSLDFSAGMPVPREEFRAGECPPLWKLIWHCGSAIVGCILAAPTLVGLAGCGYKGAKCGYTIYNYIEYC